MPKEYVVDSAELSCQYGNQPSRLTVPGHRHILAAGFGFANEGDITPECLGSFGSCTSPFRTDGEAVPYGTNGAPGAMTRGCEAEVRIPWQGTQPDVYAAKCKGILEEGWTVCEKGFGIISILHSGQGAAAANAAVLEKLQELEAAADSYMKANGIPEKARAKLMASVLVGNGTDESSWKRKSDDMTNEFHDYLKKDDPALYNFFERDIVITDTVGQQVDLNYFINLTHSVRDTVYMEDYYEPELINTPEKFNAYLDAYNVNEMYRNEMKDMSWSELINHYYSLDGKGSSKAESRYTDYVHSDVSAEELRQFWKYAGIDNLSDDELQIEYRIYKTFEQWQGGEEETLRFFTDAYTNRLINGISEERGRQIK